ncbi:two-partner secretion domain-containing protein [Sphingomonas morindae]|uniref:Hemagglutinin repeat-containing protein n=1 Tax=Sphingomonas morindae TaxID=1541170 RepID=A0ABY4X982_9SPHN|nr:hemagglutinin repeat-containing protein [Sphingomonas morindae]USI73480.1 hemagglutinin repeat-containing protein [Sphingomonas morindae]
MERAVPPASCRTRRRALRALMLAALATSALSPARAQTGAPIATPPLQPADRRTGLDVTPAGTPIVNIATPDASGTSHNVFTRLSVGKEGLIFDNSPTTGRSVIGGFLIANPNLGGGRAASLILNEVTGGVRTTLAGPLEIFGPRAALVVANPSGITCDGCGFLNTGRVSLAAATLRFAADGGFDGFRIAEGGDVAVEGRGLLAGNVDYFDIIAAATRLNASLYTKDLLIAGGSGSVDYASRTASAAGAAARPGVAIDSSILGGMYANRIRLVGTGAGLGINLRGTVAALEGPLTITSDGALALAGTFAAGDATLTAAQGAVTLTDRLYAGGGLAITGQTIRQSGGLAGAGGDVALRAGGDIALEGGDGVFAGIDGTGARTFGGAVSIVAGGAVEAGGATLAAGGALAIDARALRQGAAGRFGGTNVTLRTQADQALAGTSHASQDMELTGDAISLTGTLAAHGRLTLSGRQLVIAGTATGLGAATARAEEALSVAASGALQSNGMVMAAAPSLTVGGSLIGGSLRLRAEQDLRATGLLQSEGAFDLQAGAASLAGTVYAGGAARLDVGSLQSDAVLSTQDDLTVTASGDVRFGAGSTGYAKGRLTLSAATLTALGAIQSDTGLRLTSRQALTLAGRTQTRGTIDLGAGGEALLRGTLMSGGALSLTAPRVSIPGRILANDIVAMTANADNFSLAGTIQAARDVTLTAVDRLRIGASAEGATGDGGAAGSSGAGGAGGGGGDANGGNAAPGSGDGGGGAPSADGAAAPLVLNLPALTGGAAPGSLAARGAVTLSAADIEIAGTVAAKGDLTALATHVLTVRGSAWSDAALAVRGGGVDVAGLASLASAGSLAISVANDLANLGTIASNGGALALRADGMVRNGGTLSAKADLHVEAGTDFASTGTLSGEGVTVAARDLAQSGTIIGTKGLSLDGRSITLGVTSSLQSGGAVALTSSGATGIAGTLRTTDRLAADAGAALTIAAGSDIQSAGAVAFTAAGDLAMTAGSRITALGDVRLTADSLALGGTIAGNAGLALTATRDFGLSGSVTALGDITAKAGATALSGSLASARRLTLDGGATTLAATSTLQAGHRLALSATTLSGGGRIQAATHVTIASVGDLALGGRLAAGTADDQGRMVKAGDLTITAGGTLDLAAAADVAGTSRLAGKSVLLGGTLAGLGDLSLETETLVTTGTAHVDGAITASVSADATLGGALTGLAGLSISSGGAFVQNAALASNAGLILSAGGTLRHGGRSTALGDAQLTGAALSLAGSIRANGDLSLTSRAGDIALAEGAQASARATTLHAAGDARLAGSLAGAASLTVRAGHALDIAASGVVQAGISTADGGVTRVGSLLLAAGARLANAGTLGATGGLTATAQALSSTGTVSAGGAIDLTGATATIGGSVAGLDTVTIRSTAGATAVIGSVEARDVAVSAAGGDLTLAPGARLTAFGTGADGTLALTSGGAMDLRGRLSANNDLTLEAATSLSVAADSGGPAIGTLGRATLRAGAGLTNAGTIAAGKDLLIAAAALDSAHLAAGGGIVADIGGAITLRGTSSAQAASGILVSARGGDVVLAEGARVETPGALRLSAAGALTNAGVIAAGSTSGSGPEGGISLSSGAALRSTGAIVSNNGSVALRGASITLGGAIGQSGGVYAAGALGLDAGDITLLSGAQAIGHSGLRAAGARLTLGEASLLQSNRTARIALSGGYVSSGDLVALGDLALELSGGTIANQAGAGIFAGGAGATAGGGSVTLSADGIANAGTIVATASAGGAGGDATLRAGAIAQAGLLHADHALNLNAASVTLSGTAEAGTAIAWSIPSLTLEKGGALRSAGGITLSGTDFANAGTVAAAGDLAITASGDLTSHGLLTTPGALQLASGSVLTLGAGSQTIAGSAQATPAIGGGNVTLRGAGVHSLGTLSATGSLGITADTVRIGDATLVNGDVTLAGERGGAPTLTVDAGASLGTYLGDARLGALSTLTLAGSLTATNGSVRVSAGATRIGAAARLAAGRDVAIGTTGGGALTLDGQILAGNDLTLSGGTLAVGAGGTAQAGDDLTVESVDAATGSGAVGINGTDYDVSGTPITARLSGKISAGHDLRLSMAGAVLADGPAQIIAGNDMTLAAGHLLLGARYRREDGGRAASLGVIAGHDLLLRSSTLLPGGLVLDGSVQAGNNLTVEASGAVVSTAAAQLVAGHALAVSGSALSLSGFNSGQTLVAFTATGTAGDVTLAGATASNGRVVISAETATVRATGSISVRGGAGNTAGIGRDIGRAANLDIETNGGFTNQGSLWSDGAAFLKAAHGDIVNAASGANGGITARTIVAQADAGTFVYSAGAFKGDTVGLFLGGDFTNSGSFAPSGDYWISAANIRNAGLMATSGDLTLQAAGSLYNVGTIYAGRRLNLSAGGALTNDYVGDDQGNGSHGLILAQGDIAITAHDVANQSATIQSLGGGIQIGLTGGDFLNSVKRLNTSASSGGMGRLFIERATGQRLSEEEIRGNPNIRLVRLIEEGLTLAIDAEPFLNDLNDFLCIRSDSTASNIASCLTRTDLPGRTRSVRIYEMQKGEIASTVTGPSKISAARSIMINAGAGGVTNSNSSILAGDDVRVTTAGSVTNVSDLLVSGGVNTPITAAPTLIRAGGTITINAGSFKNIAKNLIGADRYTANQLVEHAGGAGPSASAPATFSAGNGASATPGAAERVALSGTSVGGTGAVGAAAGGGLSARGKGDAASGALTINAALGVGVASARERGGAGIGGAVDVGAAAGARIGGASGDPVWEAERIGEIGRAADGAAAPAWAATDLQGASAPGGAGGSGGPGASALLPALVAGLNDTGAPIIANAAFGTFVGGFLASFNLTGNAPSLFTYSANPGSRVLFTSNAALSSEAALYDSKWFFDRVAPDRATTYARLGDGFFEALLVSRAVQAQSGRAQLADYGSALDQYQGLLKNAEKARTGLGLRLGVALTPEQVAALTEPLLWYVQSKVGGRDLLVPVVYLAASQAKAIAGGALVAGTDVAITARDGIENSGTLDAKAILALASQGGDIANTSGGTIEGGAVLAQAGGDIRLAGGSTIRADAGLALDAGRDLVTDTIRSTSTSLTSDYRDERHWWNRRTVSEQVTGATLAAGGDLTIRAGGDIGLRAATLSAGGAARLAATGTISLGGVTSTTTTSYAERTGKYTKATSTETATRFLGTTVTAAGPVSLAAGADLSITGGSVRSAGAGAGDGIALYGGQGIAIVSAEESATLDRFARTGKKSRATTHATSTTHQRAELDAAAGLRIASPGAVRVEGAVVSAQGALALDAASLTLAGVVDTVDARVDTVSKKSGLFSSTTRRTSSITHDETALASTLSGDTTRVTTSGAVTITGANLVASNGLALVADGPVTIAARATTDRLDSRSSVKKSGFSLGGDGLFLGVAKTSTTRQVAETVHTGSLLGTAAGDAAIVSGGRLSITGSRVAAGGDVRLQGATVEIANALNASDTSQTTQSSSVGLSIGVQSQLLQSLGNAVDMGRIATSTGNDRVVAVAGLAGGMAAVNAVNAGKDLARTLTSGSGSLGVSVGVTFGISTSRATSTAHDETVVGSQVRGRDVAIIAQGTGAGGTIAVRGTTVEAARDLTLAANGAITLVAATEANRQSGDARSSGFTLGLTAQLGLDKGKPAAMAPTISVGVSSSNSHYAGTRITNQESVLRAGGTATLTTPGALGLDGALVSGDRLVVEAGSLAIASRQDSSRYASHARSASLGASVALGTGQVSLSGNVSSGRQQGDFASVAEQAGLYAGDGGFAIRVRGDTSLTGAVIASTADAAKNSLVTGTLHAADIQNRESWDAQQIALGGGIGGIGADRGGRATPQGATRLPGVRLGRLGTLTAAPPMAFGAGRAQSGTTQSAIAPATITISTSDPASTARVETLRRDTAGANAGALRQQFDEAKREEVANGFQAAQTLVVETSAFLSTQASAAESKKKMADKLAAESALARINGDTTQAEWLSAKAKNLYADAEKWLPGGTYRQIAGALAAAGTGNVTGSIGGFAQSAVVNFFQQKGASYIGDLVRQGVVREGSPEQAALHALVACAGAAASGANCGSAAMGSAAATVLTSLFPPAKPGEKTAEVEAKANLVNALVTGTAAAIGDDSASSSTATQANLDNNWLSSAQYQAYRKELAACGGIMSACSWRVVAKYSLISGKQNFLTKAGFDVGLAKGVVGDLTGLFQLLKDPGTALSALGSLLRDPELVKQIGREKLDRLVADYRAMSDDLARGGDHAAYDLGERLAGLAYDISSALVNVGASAKLAKIGVAGVKVVAEDAAAVARGATALKDAQTIRSLLKAGASAKDILAKLSPLTQPFRQHVAESLAAMLGADGITITSGGTGARLIQGGVEILYDSMPKDLQALARFVKSGADKTGAATEALFTKLFSATKYVELDAKYGSNKGIDHLLQGPDGKVLLVIDAKQINASGSVSLSKLKNGDLQLSAEWIDKVLEKLADSPAAKAIEQAQKDRQLVTVVGGVDRSTGNVVLAKVNVPSRLERGL